MKKFLRNSKRRATTITEMAVSVGTISFVAITVSFLTVTSAKVSKEGVNMLRSEARVRNGLDLVRRQALAGKQNSIEIGEDGRSLRYHDPWAKAHPSFRFEEGLLNFYPDDGADVLYSIGGINDVVFAFDDDRRSLTFTITAAAIDGNNVTRYLTLEDEIVLRNKPTADEYF